MDNTAISISWPGHSAFGPHRDRPFDNNSKYAAGDEDAPPQDHPESVQVIWTLDHFGRGNGGFFVVPGDFGGRRGGGSGVVEEHVVPENARFVTAEKGR